MSKFNVTASARNHLVEIAEFTLLEWGERQMAVYMGSLNARFQWLADNPDLGKRRPELAADIRSYREGSHIVFYKPQSDAIDIIAVLHQSRDIAGYFED